ncbi:MAG: helix-turn-helix domain-containing protein [Bacillus sp. (in: Bacteria)]|nr:helix-turn-helix domain-containing protein [Bacillus sp. (in: firmicutes)]
MLDSISERIKNRRKELKMSQSELANQIGLKPPAISQYESGARRPSYEVLRKLSTVLKVSSEYLVSGIHKELTEQTLDQTDRVILKIINTLSENNKEKLVEYACFLATGRKMKIDTLLASPSEYASNILKEKTNGSFPIDVYDIGRTLGIKIFEDAMDEGEGILLQGEHPVIILKNDVPSPHRKLFTLAALIGHYCLPWHLKSTYIARKYGNDLGGKGDSKEDNQSFFGQSTLLTDEIEEMEANQFATSLLLPTLELDKDSFDGQPSLETLKSLAYEKYHVSLFLFLNRLVDYSEKKFAVVQSQDSAIIKTFSGEHQLRTGNLDPRTKAASFFTDPSNQEEVRVGELPTACWLVNGNETDYLLEQSIYNPLLRTVLTLLTLKK